MEDIAVHNLRMLSECQENCEALASSLGAAQSQIEGLSFGQWSGQAAIHARAHAQKLHSELTSIIGDNNALINDLSSRYWTESLMIGAL